MAFSMFSAQTSPIAIDFGTSSVKLIQTGSGDPPSLQAAAEIPVPDEIRQDQSQLYAFYAGEISRVLRTGGFKGKRVVCAIPSGLSYVQHMQLSAVDGLGLEELIKGQLQMQMGCSPASIVVRSIEVTEVHRNDQALKEIICFAVSRDTVMRYVEILKRCKLEPVGVHTETMAMVRAFDHLNRRTDDSKCTTLYVDMGWSGTRLAIAHGRHIKFARFVQLGGRDFDQKIASERKCDLAAAREHRLKFVTPFTAVAESDDSSDEHLPEGMAVLKSAVNQANAADRSGARGGTTTAERRVGAVPRELRYRLAPEATSVKDIGVDLGELLEMMSDELSMCLRYHRALFPGRSIDRAIFLGGEARQMWLCQHLIRVLRLPAQLGDPLARLTRNAKPTTTGLSLDDPQPGWAVACGLSVAPTDL